ncbi:MAG: FAD-dependent oxidoreductase [Saprospiraceae bacterium]|nr:FAD-dependent oxidoreductase [Saprospiraceae bacterium]
MPTTWYDSVVTKIEDASPHVKRFWLETPGAERPEFKAGQFVTMDLPIGEKRLQRWRSYSIANAPADDPNLLELCIVKAPEGLGSKYFFEEVHPGSTLRWKGPDGTFCLPETISKDLVLICTGTGVAPFRSMLRDLQHSGRPHRNIHLIFGTRTEADILYREEFEALARTIPGFRYDVALSRQPDWPGYQGYVHQIYLKEYAEKRPDVQFYICGWGNMIDEAVANLLIKLGYDRTQILYELYG